MSARALTIVTHALGAVAFLYPFVLPRAAAAEAAAHASDAPYLFSAFGALLIAMAVAEVRAGSSDVRRIALLGVLAGVNAVLRLPGSLGGASLMFALPIMCGAVFGARAGFLLGASSMAASAVITGGVGPWVPFQMWAMGWVGAGGAVVRPLVTRTPRAWVVVALAAYGWLAGYVFGALVDLWFWPFQQGSGPLAWRPGAGVAEGIARFWRFYVATSLAWDAARALGNAVLLVALGAPVLRLLERSRRRIDARWSAADRPAAAHASMGA